MVDIIPNPLPDRLKQYEAVVNEESKSMPDYAQRLVLLRRLMRRGLVPEEARDVVVAAITADVRTDTRG